MTIVKGTAEIVDAKTVKSERKAVRPSRPTRSLSPPVQCRARYPSPALTCRRHQPPTARSPEKLPKKHPHHPRRRHRHGIRAGHERMDVEVTVVEHAAQILPTEDEEIAKAFSGMIQKGKALKYSPAPR